jgi:hypothetical protein
MRISRWYRRLPTTPTLVTDDAQAVQPEWLARLRSVIRASAHETRNTLNGVVVNLEVVRNRLARAADGSPETLPFAEQATAQAEESVKLNEAVGSLLLLITGAVDPHGSVRCTQEGGEPGRLRFQVDLATADRTLPGLRALGDALDFSVETDDGGAVILTFPHDGSTETIISE